MNKAVCSVIFNCIFLLSISKAQVPVSWRSTGIGGGGALFSPSINPLSSDEYFVACDMGELFHSTDFGNSYDQVSFSEIQSGINSKIVFTNNTLIRYCIDYRNNQVLPVRTDDGGISWHSLAGNPDPASEVYGIWADYSNAAHVLISYYNSVWFSADGGASFSLIHSAVNANSGILVGGVFFDGQNICIGTNNGLLSSQDGGMHFTIEATSGIPQGQAIYSFAGAKQGNATRFFAITGDTSSVVAGMRGSDYYGLMRGVYRMNNANGTWNSCMPGITPSSDYMMFVTMAMNDTSTAYLAGSTPLAVPNLMKTSNGGNYWNHIFLTSDNQNIHTGWCGDGGDRSWSYAECPFGISVCPTNSA